MSDLVQQVRDGKASEVLVRDADIVVELKAEGDQKPQRIVATRLPGIDETALVKEMQDKGVKFSGSSSGPRGSETFLARLGASHRGCSAGSGSS